MSENVFHSYYGRHAKKIILALPKSVEFYAEHRVAGSSLYTWIKFQNLSGEPYHTALIMESSEFVLTCLNEAIHLAN